MPITDQLRQRDLTYAIENASLEDVKAALAAGSDPNSEPLGSDYHSPLEHAFAEHCAGRPHMEDIIRELIKDLEDQEGDRYAGLRTAPLIWGQRITKRLAFAFSILLFGIIAFYGWKFGQIFDRDILAYLLMGILLPVSLVIIWQIKAKSKKGFHQSSQIWKGIMVLGLLLLLFF